MRAATSGPSHSGAPLPAWRPGPRDPQLGVGDVHVWRADLAAVKGETLELLSPEEYDRAQRLTGLRDRQVWAASRGVLRALLGRYVHTDPRELQLAVGAAGKPALDTRASSRDPAAVAPALSFNL